MTWPTFKNFTVARDDRGVISIALDVPARPLNVIDQSVLTELEAIVARLEEDAGARVVVFRSGKPSGFLAGADVNEISRIADDAAVEVALIRGQHLLDCIERLPAKTIAAIHGPCLGGGLELALACDYRIARDDESTQLGLPEIRLGLIPGWGGTQRLPRAVGLIEALPMILQGKNLSASQAARIGLVDRAVTADDWDRELANFATESLQAGDPAVRSARKPRSRSILSPQSLVIAVADRTPLGRHFVFNQAERQIARNGNSTHYPALPAALRAIRAGYASGGDGYPAERKEFVELLRTPTCRHLLGLFLRRDQARSVETWVAIPSAAKDTPLLSEPSVSEPSVSGPSVSGPPRSAPSVSRLPVRKLAVIGAGAMGAGIGQLAALKGLTVVLKEIDPSAAAAGLARVRALFDDLVAKQRLSRERRDACLDRVEVTVHWEPLQDADLVVEAVVENEEVKNQVFADLDNYIQPAGLLTSNTSALSIARMAAATHRASNVAGLHFFNPVHRMELVEIARTPQTSDATVSQLVRFARALGKTPVVTADRPGFVVNRVLFPYLGEAVQMVCEGIPADAIDRDIRHFGMPMGPLELLDQVGIDIAVDVAHALASVLVIDTAAMQRLAAMRDQGWLGKKMGKGFYKYERGKSAGPSMWHESSPIDAAPEPPQIHPDGLNATERRLLYPLINEAVRCLDEKIVREPWMVDLAMVLGTGFAPYRGGPLQMLDDIGADTVFHNLSAMQPIFGARVEPAAGLVRAAHGDELQRTDPIQPSLEGVP